MEGVSSARQLQRLTERDLAYRWICGEVGVNYHLLSDFRTAHGEVCERYQKTPGNMSQPRPAPVSQPRPEQSAHGRAVARDHVQLPEHAASGRALKHETPERQLSRGRPTRPIHQAHETANEEHQRGGIDRYQNFVANEHSHDREGKYRPEDLKILTRKSSAPGYINRRKEAGNTSDDYRRAYVTKQYAQRRNEHKRQANTDQPEGEAADQGSNEGQDVQQNGFTGATFLELASWQGSAGE